MLLCSLTITQVVLAFSFFFLSFVLSFFFQKAAFQCTTARVPVCRLSRHFSLDDSRSYLCVVGYQRVVRGWVRGTLDGQLLLMQAHAVPFELNWRVWVGLGHIVLSKLCCFKIAKREARVQSFVCGEVFVQLIVLVYMQTHNRAVDHNQLSMHPSGRASCFLFFRFKSCLGASCFTFTL